MEKTWETFWTTGKVTDYLTYRNGLSDVTGGNRDQGQKEQLGYGTVRDSDGHGFDGHACQ